MTHEVKLLEIQNNDFKAQLTDDIKSQDRLKLLRISLPTCNQFRDGIERQPYTKLFKS